MRTTEHSRFIGRRFADYLRPGIVGVCVAAVGDQVGIKPDDGGPIRWIHSIHAVPISDRAT